MKRSPRRRFAHKLAVRLGILHVERDIMRGLTAKEFRAWEMYDEVNPIGDERADIRAAQIVQTLANVNRGKNQRPYKLEEFVLKFGAVEKDRTQTPEQQFGMLKVLSAMYANDATPQIDTTPGKVDMPPEIRAQLDRALKSA